MAKSPFRSIQRVYFDDLDALNILHNVKYMLFFERARGEMANSLGFRWEDDTETNPDRWQVVAAHEVQYLVPIRGECEVLIEVMPKKIGNSSCIMEQVMKSVDEKVVHATGTTRIVRLDPETNRPCSWSPRFRAAMAPWLA